MKYLNKLKFQLLIHGQSVRQLNKTNNSNLINDSNIKIELFFDKYINKLKTQNERFFFKKSALNKTIKITRKRYGFPINGQRTRSNSRTALLLKNKYKN